MFRTIRRRIAFPFVFLILGTMLGIGLYVAQFARQVYRNTLQIQLETNAHLIADAVRHQLILHGNLEPDLNDEARNWSEITAARVTILTEDGAVLGDSQPEQALVGDILQQQEIEQAAETGLGFATRAAPGSAHQTLFIAVPVAQGEQITAFVRLAASLEQAQTNANLLLRALLGATILVTLLAILLAIWIAQDTTLPLRRLTEAASRIAEGSIEERLIPPHLDEVGRLTQAFNIMTRQLQNQIIELEKERSKMATVLQEMTDGVVIVDPAGNVQMLNPAAEAMFGIEHKAALGRSLATGLRHHQLIELWQKSLESGEPQSTIIEISTNRLYLQGVATSLGAGLPGSTLLLFQNLTRQRYLETMRRDFISNISHELRTPLASLKALTETLQEGALDDPPAARRFLDRMETEVDALTHMVSELLELSRIESGQVPMRLHPLSASELLGGAIDRLRMQAERSHIDIQVEYPAEPAEILADPARLEQVLVNLLHNAIKFTPHGGKITLQATPGSAEMIAKMGGAVPYPHTGEEYMLFSVSDTGIGISADDLPRIFERFFKSDRARATGGTGLGLAIARHTVEAHGGQVWASSIEGQGSTFYFYIPLAGQAVRAKTS